MTLKLDSSPRVVGSVKLWTYRAIGIVPAGLPSDPGFLERAIRSAVSWNDTMLSWLRGTDVTEEVVSEQQLRDLKADFDRRLSGH